MGSYQNPVGGSRDPYDKLRVEPIEEDKLTKNDRRKPPVEKSSDEKLGAAAYLLQAFRSIVDFFLESPSMAKSVEKDARENLLRLKEAFEILKKQDRSQDIQFLNDLSKIWQHVLEDCLRFNRDSSVAEQFKALVKKIQHYPPGQPHTFGYYLAEYAGQKWIPFPYMELVQKLHNDHEKNPTVSALVQWTVLIDELISLLKIEQK